MRLPTGHSNIHILACRSACHAGHDELQQPRYGLRWNSQRNLLCILGTQDIQWTSRGNSGIDLKDYGRYEFGVLLFSNLAGRISQRTKIASQPPSSQVDKTNLVKACDLYEDGSSPRRLATATPQSSKRY